VYLFFAFWAKGAGKKNRFAQGEPVDTDVQKASYCQAEKYYKDV